MAGKGRKQWTRETLSSADVQDYLQDQVVFHFANAAARAAQLPAPTEGMHSTLDDLDTTERYDGTRWVPIRYGAIRGKMWRTIGGSANLATTGVENVVGMGASRVAGGFTFGGDALTIPMDGRYDLEQIAYLTNGGTGNAAAWVRRIRSGVGNGIVSQLMLYKPFAGIDIQDSQRTPDIPLKAGDQLQLIYYAYHASMAFYGVQEAIGCALTATYAGPLNGATPL